MSNPEDSFPTGTDTRNLLVEMVRSQIIARGLRDPLVLESMRKVPRHLFVPKETRILSYTDDALPIGYGQTISQPYIVAFMTQAARIRPEDRILEIGTGSGYQSAILAEIAKEVYSIEIVPQLADRAKSTLHDLGYTNIHIRHTDGFNGWPEKAPFDVIIVTAAPKKVPESLLNQLKTGGRMVIPVGETEQNIYLYEKTEEGLRKSLLLPVRFVPMVHGDSIDLKEK